MNQETNKYKTFTFVLLAISMLLFILYISKSCPVINSNIGTADNPYTQPNNDICFNFTASQLVCHSDSIGNYICQGELTNNCNKNYQFVKVIGSYYENNRFIGTSETYVTTSGIEAGGTLPFTIYTTENGIIFDGYKLRVEAS